MSDQSQSTDVGARLESLTPATWDLIQESLRGLHFGQVLLVVHEGAIVQVERTERKRISRPSDGS